MLQLSINRQQFDQGFRSAAGLVEDLEHLIESLTLANRSPFHLQRLQQTIIAPGQEIQRLSITSDNNGSESDLRMFKLQQNSSGCFRSNEGFQVFCDDSFLFEVCQEAGQKRGVYCYWIGNKRQVNCYRLLKN